MARRRSDDNEWIDEDDEHDDIDDGDFDETEQDEADQKRFSSKVGFCPECGAEIADDADICPKCFTWIDGTTHSRPSAIKRFLRVAVVVLLILAAVLGGIGFVMMAR